MSHIVKLIVSAMTELLGHAKVCAKALFLGSIILLGMTFTAYSFNIPAEPGQDKVLMRYIKPQLRAFIIIYDLDGDGIGDYMTQRDIGQNYAMIGQYPIYYGIDLNGDGKLDETTEVFIDPQRDGLNGNEMSLVEWEEMQKNVES